MVALNPGIFVIHGLMIFCIIASTQVHGEWLVYSNQLVLFPALVLTSTGSVIVRGATAVIPVECHYKR